MSSEIRRATAADADALTHIAHAAKRHWGYPETWIASWREQLTLRPEFIAQQRVFALEIDARIVGFYALQGSGAVIELEHLWVLPEKIGQGLGRQLLEHALATSRASGAQQIEIDADPFAEAFYEHLGARRIGKTPAPVDGDPERFLPRMTLAVESAYNRGRSSP